MSRLIRTNFQIMPPDSEQMWKVYNELINDLNDGKLVLWKIEWSAGTYYKGDMVIDDSWAMVANKTTTDKPAPAPFGTPAWLLPTAPVWEAQSYLGTVYTGIQIQPLAGELFSVNAFRIWMPDVSATANYRVIVYDVINDLYDFGEQFTGDVLAEPGWLTVGVPSRYLNENSNIVFTLESYNSAATTDFNYPWVYDGPAQTGDPGPGLWTRTNQQDVVDIDYLDDGGVDRSADLGTVVPGSFMRMESQADPLAYWEYRVDTAVDSVGFYSYSVSYIGEGPNGGVPVGQLCSIFFEVPVPLSTDYVRIVDQYANTTGVSGYLAFDELLGGVQDNNAYGIDVQFQQYTVSEDWDPLAYSGGNTQQGTGGARLNSINVLDTENWWDRWTVAEKENLAKLATKNIYAPQPPPSWEEVFYCQQFIGYTATRSIDLSDTYVYRAVHWLESINVIGPGRAAIILAS